MKRAANEERRSYFRIEDEVLLDYRRLQPNENLEQLPEDCADALDGFALQSKLGSLSRRLRPALTRMRHHQPEFADALAALDDKVEAVAAVLLAQQLGQLGSRSRRVSLSAGGLAFHVAEAIPAGAGLELRLVLLPSFAGLTARVRVERCDRQPDFRDGFPYRIAAAFSAVSETHRALLVKHGLARQVARRHS